MASIVIIEHDASPSRLSKAIESAKSISDDVILVGDNRSALDISGCQQIKATDTTSAGAALECAARLAKDSQIVFADARVASFSSLKRFCDAATLDGDTAISLASTEVAGELIQLPPLLQENIVAVVGLYPHLPFQIFRAQKTLISDIPQDQQNAIAWATSLLLKAISENLAIDYQEEILHLDTRSTLDEIAYISNQDRARILSQAVALNNIEDLFPRHAWNEHREESAAAAYHSLAALFVRLGDSQSADECLQLSDSLEDSPRSLALKGLIAKEKGEVLGAVANLVSSLQQYETRKRNNGEHYLTFLPKDIENINSRLQAGLEALNKRDNSGAFDNFVEAIFNFDDFYSTYGVDKIKRAV